MILNIKTNYKAVVKLHYTGEVILFDDFNKFKELIIYSLDFVGPTSYEVKIYDEEWKKLYFEILDRYYI